MHCFHLGFALRRYVPIAVILTLLLVSCAVTFAVDCYSHDKATCKYEQGGNCDWPTGDCSVNAGSCSALGTGAPIAYRSFRSYPLPHKQCKTIPGESDYSTCYTIPESATNYVICYRLDNWSQPMCMGVQVCMTDGTIGGCVDPSACTRIDPP